MTIESNVFYTVSDLRLFHNLSSFSFCSGLCDNKKFWVIILCLWVHFCTSASWKICLPLLADKNSKAQIKVKMTLLLGVEWRIETRSWVKTNSLLVPRSGEELPVCLLRNSHTGRFGALVFLLQLWIQPAKAAPVPQLKWRTSSPRLV